jgi:C-terminal processing protease CtpA/Prc
MLLVGPRTFSAAEDFAVAFDYMKRGKIIGQPTGGSTGQPVSFDLPGGGTARVCGKRDSYPNGKEFVGVGIIPDIVIMPTINDLKEEQGNSFDKRKLVPLVFKRHFVISVCGEVNNSGGKNTTGNNRARS